MTWSSASPVHRLRSRLVVGLLVALLAWAVTVSDRTSAGVRPSTTPVGTTARAAAAQHLAAGLKLVSYYPRDRAWEQQWTRFSARTTAADLATVRSLGATSVRIIVFPSVLGYPRPSTAQQRKLRKTIELADASGLQVWLTLYDNFGTYQDLAGSRTWTKAVLAPYAGDGRIEAVEIRNEIKETPSAMAWARDQVALVHRLSPATPVALSLNGSVEPEAYATLLEALAPQRPDVLSYHYYGNPGMAYDRFRRVLASADGVPVVVGEAGLTTAAVEGRCDDVACREAEQVDWFQLVVAAARQAGLSPPAPWMLYDLDLHATRRPLAASAFGYGLIRTDGTSKPAAAVVADDFADRWTTVPQNVDFLEVSSGGLRARGWTPWRPSGTFRVEQGAGVAGAPALVVRGTKSWSDGASGWFARPLTAVRPGQTWTARVDARGTAATGRTVLALVWVDRDGSYLRQSVSATLPPGTSDWTELSVVAVAPAGAVAVRLHLTSGANDGTAYFSRPRWSVSG